MRHPGNNAFVLGGLSLLVAVSLRAFAHEQAAVSTAPVAVTVTETETQHSNTAPIIPTPVTETETQHSNTAPITPTPVTETRPENPVVLQPFKAYYQANFRIGMTLSGEAVRELRPLAQGGWELQIHAKALLAKFNESSQFEIVDGRIRPLSYNYYRKSFGRKKTAQLTFDWDNAQVHNNTQNKPWSMPIDTPTYDKISYQLQLQLDLKAGREDLRYQIADGGHLKTYHFVRQAEETVKTPAGSFKAVKVLLEKESSDRTTLIWFAPELDYLIVKLSQKDNDERHVEMLLKKVN